MNWEKFRVIKFFLLVFAFLLHQPVFAVHKVEFIDAQLNLDKLECLSVSEQGRDELYFHITEINPQGKYRLHRVPEVHPEYWSVHKGSVLNNIPLYRLTLAEGEAVTLIISLMDSDLSKFNPDDLIGVAKVVVANKKHRLDVRWGLPNANYQPNVKSVKKEQMPEYRMSGDGGDYVVSFSVKSVDRHKNNGIDK